MLGKARKVEFEWGLEDSGWRGKAGVIVKANHLSECTKKMNR